MGKKNRRDKRIDTSGAEGPLTSSPFAGLAGLGGAVPAGEAPPPEEEAPRQEPSGAAPRRAVVRFSRKGRGGKEVTLVQHLDLPPDELDRWLAELKRALGCGGAREDDQLVFQGDQRPRLPDLLRGRGVKKVSV